MHQGAAFAADRSRRSITTIALDADGTPLLVCLRRLPLIGLSVASISRGPAAPTDAQADETLLIPRLLQRVGAWLRKEAGVIELRVDPWLPASDAIEAEWRRAGFAPCEESFFSKNAMWIRATARVGATEGEVFSLLGSSKRNQVNAARRSEIKIVRLPREGSASALEEAAALVAPGVGVRMRTSPGGAGPVPVARQIERFRERLAADRARVLTHPVR